MHWSRYFLEPEQVGPLPGADTIGRAGGGCGDLVSIELKFAGPIISEAAFLATGCPGAIAGAAASVSLLPGRTIYEAATLCVADFRKVLVGMPAERQSCLQLAEAALSAALESYLSRDSVKLPESGRTAVAMSGGVDSSTAAFCLLDAGESLLGLTQRLHDYGDVGTASCCTPADLEDARAVAIAGGFPHYVLDMRREFAAEVIEPFCQSYLNARTPNPCVDCNRHLRWGRLLVAARRLGAATLATGHYLRIVDPDRSGRFSIQRAIDREKDQSYMFWSVPSGLLASLKAPLGSLTKKEVRAAAAASGLPVAEKSESQDVCFVPEGDYAGFVTRETGFRPEKGPIIGADGQLLGEHRGLIHYTIGQRRGLGVSAAQPLYVTALDLKQNAVHVGPAAALGVKRLTVSEVNLLAGHALETSFKAQIMLRYNGPLESASVHIISDTQAVVEFDRPFGPVAPGQSAVFYDGDSLIGGGVVD